MDYLIYKGKCKSRTCPLPLREQPNCGGIGRKEESCIIYSEEGNVTCVGRTLSPLIPIDLLVLITAREKNEKFRSFLKSLLRSRLSAK